MTASTGQPFPVAEWLHLVYTHPDRPPALQRDILTALVAGGFTTWKTGKATASIEALSDFCRAARSTVQRALRWGCQARLLLRTLRGHRLGNGKKVASEWQLQIPAAAALGRVS